MPYPDVMIDLETLSADPDAPIIQLGAVAFNIKTGELGPSFSSLIKPDLRKQPASLATVAWWMQQEQAARDVVSRCHTDGLEPAVALQSFIDWFEISLNTFVEVWAMPPEFDLVILANMGRVYGRSMPWAYNRTRDLRTLESLVGASSKDRVRATVAHDARADAIAQAQTAIAYRKMLVTDAARLLGAR